MMKKMLAIDPVVVCPEGADELIQCAAQVFVEEIALHTGRSLRTSSIPMGGTANVVIAQEQDFRCLCPRQVACLERLPAPGAEGFRLFAELVDGKQLDLYAVGSDPRGTFYAMGQLLRLLELSEGKILADMLLDGISSTPQCAMRGHQLGYRDKQNTLPCWTEKEFDRYIRDLALFGTNSIELLPPRTDDHLFSREMQVDPFDLMVHVAQIVKHYGLDLWLWYPNMGESYDDPACLAAELAEREKVFSALPPIEGVLVPAGDPGDLEPKQLFSVTEKCATILHRYHPSARVMLAPQCFAPDPGWYDAFYAEVSKTPDWLWGVSFAPWEKDSIEEMVRKLPAIYQGRIRHYPDITHEMGCQFALPVRDPAFGIVQGRECCDPRPRAMRKIHQTFAPYCVGSITYSEGVHDDVNKFVWGQMDWDDTQSPEHVLREYVRYFIDPTWVTELTRGVMLLEDSWNCPKPIEENPFVEEAYNLFQDVDSRASAKVRANWRYQLLLLRALADHAILHRKKYEDALERQARQVLSCACETGSIQAIRQACALLDLATDEPCEPMLRDRILRLSDALHASCGIKLTTKHHGGQSWKRGAWIDMLDTPLNDAQFFRVTMKHILRMETEEMRCAAITAMLERTNPGPEGVYVDLGSPESRSFILSDSCWDKDPSLLHTPFTTVDMQALDQSHTFSNTWREMPVPKALLTSIVTYYDQPLTLRIPVSHAQGDYVLKLGYFLQGSALDVRLTAGNGQVIHERVEARDSTDPWYAFHVSEGAICEGALTLTWTPFGRVHGVRVNELLLQKKQS